MPNSNALLKKIFFAIAFIFIVVNLSAHNIEPIYRKYTVDNGLPSSVVYHAFQDSKGYMWFATANGVSKYDGYRFENFDLQSGLVDNEVFEIYEDYKHRIWFIPMSGQLAYYENGKIVAYKYNCKIKECLPSGRGPIKCSFYVDSLDYVYLSVKQFGRISISPEGIPRKFENEKNVNLNIEEIVNGKFLITTTKNGRSPVVKFSGLYQKFSYTLFELIKTKYLNHHHLFFQLAPDSSVYFSLYHNLVNVKNGKIECERDFNQDIIWLSIDKSNNLWVAFLGGGVECYENCDFSKKPRMRLLNNTQVSSVLQDNEGAYWFSTLNHGVFYCSNINFVTYKKEDGLHDDVISAICHSNDAVFIGYKFGFVDRLRDDSVKHFSPPEKYLNSSIRSVSFDSSSNTIWVCSIDNLYWIKKDQLFHLGSTPSRHSVFPKVIVKSKYGGYWIGSTDGLVKFDGVKVSYESCQNNEFAGVVYDLVEDCKGTIWFCTLTGLWKYSKGNFQYLGADNLLLNQAGSRLIFNPVDSSLWMGTNGGGIVVMNNRMTYQITKADGLISNSIHQLFCSGSNVWVGTRQGLSRILIKKEGLTIQNFTNANGLPTNEVLSVCEFKGKVYVGTSKGLTVFEKDKIVDNDNVPNIIITSLMVNNKQIDLSLKNIDLAYDQNSLHIDFVGFVYRKEGSVQYRYRMVGIDTSWVQTQTPNCFYNGLACGDYKFEVDVQSHSGIWRSSPASVSFKICPPFWKTTWFLIIEALLFSFLILIVFRVRFSNVKRRNDLIYNINLYKQQSLRQQMNPHFIFNTLNSIQLYILEKDSISSHKYLTKFARLMRMTLDNSLNSTIPLRDEIGALELYLELEKLRFEGKFDYIIDYGEDESLLNYKIPTLLIQPFVENAIWHGIMLKKDSTGRVKITLVDRGSILICTVEDNGIGRKQAETFQQLQNKEHKSRGSQITQQRIELLNVMYKEKFNIVYEDLTDDSGTSTGTRVLISIPKDIKTNS